VTGERPSASIIVCAYGKREYTERCLASLDRALGARLGAEVELVLVDNASPDDTRELFAAWADRARVVLLDENRNFAGGNNAGAAVASGRVLVFLNNDTEVPEGVVEGLTEEALRTDVGLVGVRLRYPDGRIQHGGYGWRYTGSRDLRRCMVPFHLFHHEADQPVARTAFDTNAVTGACIAIEARLFADLGRFDEGFVNGWEDTDLCQRVRAAGGRIRYRGDLEVVHHEGVSSGGDYARSGNEERFRARWALQLRSDDEELAEQLGAHLGLLQAEARGGVAADGAGAVLAGPLRGLGPIADEARGLLAAMEACGLPPAARTPAPTWVRPAHADAEREWLDAAHARDAREDAPLVVVPDGGLAGAGARPAVLRLGAVPDAVVEDTTAWAATPALVVDLVAAGWPPERVRYVPPLAVGARPGAGGGGLLALLCDHDPAAERALLAALAGADRVAFVPTVRTSELARRVTAAVPHANLLVPLTVEEAFGEVAGRADVVVACDPADPFDRRALRAAAAGAAVVVAPGGPAEAILGHLASVADPGDPLALRAAIARCDTSAAARAQRSARVAQACGPEALRTALAALRPATAAADPGAEHAAGLAAFARGDVAEAIERLETALAAGFDPDIANDLAVALHACGRCAPATALLQECIARAPEHGAAHENLAALRDVSLRAAA
jgi:GT2 family glycosyltransferase